MQLPPHVRPLLLSAMSMLTLVGGVMAVECNRQVANPESAAPCDLQWDASAFCDNWGVNNCSGQQGSGEQAPSWTTTCMTLSQSSVLNDCRIQDANCTRKKHCTWDPTLGCLPGNYLNPPSWGQERQTYSADCVPHP